jgi:hypothetical protein
MADFKFSELAVFSALDGTEITAISQAGVSKKVPLASMQFFFGALPPIQDKDLNTPPTLNGTTDIHKTYIVGPSPTGAWASHANKIANWTGTVWVIYAPIEGWKASVLDEDIDYRYSGSAWVAGTNPNTVTVLTIVAGVVTINCALGDYFTLSLGANVTSIVFTNLPASPIGATKMVEIVQDGTGGRTVVFPASFDWDNGTIPTVSSTASTKDLLAITSFNQGASWNADLSKGRV